MLAEIAIVTIGAKLDKEAVTSRCVVPFAGIVKPLDRPWAHRTHHRCPKGSREELDGTEGLGWVLCQDLLVTEIFVAPSPEVDVRVLGLIKVPETVVRR